MRKLIGMMSLLLLVVALSVAGYANPIQVTLGPSVGAVTIGASSVSFAGVSGIAYQGAGVGTYSISNATVSMTGSGGIDTFSANSESLTVWIGSDVLGGTLSLSGLLNIPPFPAQFLGTYKVTSATPGFLSTGFSIGSVYGIDFSLNGNTISSGEVPNTVPEPGTIALVGTGLLAMARALRRRI